MKEIDMLEQILPLLTFETEDDFYYLQILRRRKDNPDTNIKNTQVIKNYYIKNTQVIKNYYIKNTQYLIDKYDEIKNICKVFNARAALRLNKRSFKKTSLKTLEIITQHLQNDDYHSSRKAYDSACGRCHNDKNKKWIVDIDEKDKNLLDHVSVSILYDCLPKESNKIYTTIETRNGYHLITKPFNVEQFRKIHRDIDIHKDNPINLYIPEIK